MRSVVKSEGSVHGSILAMRKQQVQNALEGIAKYAHGTPTIAL